MLGRVDVRLSWLPQWLQWVLVAAALVLGIGLARLPLLWAVIMLLVIVLTAVTVIDPLFGVAITLILGPSKPLTDYFVPELPLDLGQIALIVTLGSWFLHAVNRRLRALPSSTLTLPLLIFIGAASLSMPGALSLGFALKELVKWLQLFMIMLLIIDVAGARRWRFVLGAVIAAAVVQALIGVWQFGIRGDGPEHFLILGDRFYRAYGTFEQPNPYGGFIGLILPLSVGLALTALEAWVKPLLARWRTEPFLESLASVLNKHLIQLIGTGLLAGLLLAALLMSWSRGAWLGFGAAGLVILFAWPRKWWLGAALVLATVVGGLAALQLDLLPAEIADRLTGFSEFVQTFDVRGVDITPANYAVIERLAHWQAAEDMARYNFWFGVGFGNYEPIYPGYALINWPYPLGHAHNIYLNLLAETGIIGLCAYLLLWGAIFWQTWRLTRASDGWVRGISLGLMGTWTHLSAHNFLDKLYVANLHLHLGALLGVLTILMAFRRLENQAGD